MNNVFENMTQAENDFFERMKTAPQNEQEAFRIALNVLMTCFGDNAPGGLLALHIMAGGGDMTMHGFNLPPEYPPAMLAAALSVVGGGAHDAGDSMPVQ